MSVLVQSEQRTVVQQSYCFIKALFFCQCNNPLATFNANAILDQQCVCVMINVQQIYNVKSNNIHKASNERCDFTVYHHHLSQLYKCKFHIIGYLCKIFVKYINMRASSAASHHITCTSSS
ncbi:hypothetical protein Tsp_08428 [Trichinella spiralis]|uniref:hypothetical protein n=1 Tax=Trichinella spiralis TaxID=6334 RepID=UPI0001EFB583|nr:hypothetical protein Tsp_08428 [Trichinella spiralis]